MKKIKWTKVVKTIKTAISYFGAISLGIFTAMLIEFGVERCFIMGAVLSAVLMVTARLDVGDED